MPPNDTQSTTTVEHVGYAVRYPGDHGSGYYSLHSLDFRDEADREVAENPETELVFVYLRKDIDAAYAALVEAGVSLLDRIREVHEHPGYMGVWSEAQSHLGPYDGPTYTEKLAALAAALADATPKGGSDDE